LLESLQTGQARAILRGKLGQHLDKGLVQGEPVSRTLRVPTAARLGREGGKTKRRRRSEEWNGRGDGIREAGDELLDDACMNTDR
jgi:hypothetical protein